MRSLDCNAQPAKARGGVARSRLQAVNAVDDHHAPGPWRRKASWSSRERRPSRGGARTRILVGSRERRGLQTFERLRADDHGMLEKLPRRGAFVRLAMRRRMRAVWEGPSLGESRLTRSFVIVSTSLCRKRELGRCVARKRCIEDRWPSGFNFESYLHRQEVDLVVFRVTHCPLPS